MNELRWKCWPVLAAYWGPEAKELKDQGWPGCRGRPRGQTVKGWGWTSVLWHLPLTNEFLASLSCTSLGRGQLSSTAQQLPEEVTGQEGHGPAALEPGRPLVWKLSRQ